MESEESGDAVGALLQRQCCSDTVETSASMKHPQPSPAGTGAAVQFDNNYDIVVEYDAFEMGEYEQSECSEIDVYASDLDDDLDTKYLVQFEVASPEHDSVGVVAVQEPDHEEHSQLREIWPDIDITVTDSKEECHVNHERTAWSTDNDGPPVVTATVDGPHSDTDGSSTVVVDEMWDINASSGNGSSDTTLKDDGARREWTMNNVYTQMKRDFPSDVMSDPGLLFSQRQSSFEQSTGTADTDPHSWDGICSEEIRCSSADQPCLLLQIQIPPSEVTKPDQNIEIISDDLDDVAEILTSNSYIYSTVFILLGEMCARVESIVANRKTQPEMYGQSVIRSTSFESFHTEESQSALGRDEPRHAVKFSIGDSEIYVPQVDTKLKSNFSLLPSPLPSTIEEKVYHKSVYCQTEPCDTIIVIDECDVQHNLAIGAAAVTPLNDDMETFQREMTYLTVDGAKGSSRRLSSGGSSMTSMLVNTCTSTHSMEDEVIMSSTPTSLSDSGDIDGPSRNQSCESLDQSLANTGGTSGSTKDSKDGDSAFTSGSGPAISSNKASAAPSQRPQPLHSFWMKKTKPAAFRRPTADTR